jgi:hypothetical protein
MFENTKCYKNAWKFPGILDMLNMLNIALEGDWYSKLNS